MNQKKTKIWFYNIKNHQITMFSNIKNLFV